MPEEKHYVPGSPEAAAAEEAAQKAQQEAEAKAAEEKAAADAAEKAKADEAAAAEAEAKAKADADAKAAEGEKIKSRSIYDDYKDQKRETKEWKSAAIAIAKAKGIELTGSETPAELQALLDKKDETPPPASDAPPANVDDDLKAFAEAEGMSAEGLQRLVDLIKQRIPTSALSKEDQEALKGLRDFQASQTRAQEDQQILAAAPEVKKQLEIHDEGELATVMKEITRLAHTPRFADKEIDYVVWANKDALGKLVSPKRPSFEQGGQPGDAPPETAPDFSKGGVTPEQAQKAQTKSSSSLEIRRS
jgi:hypothetical protein